MAEGVPKRVLGLRQLDMMQVESENAARVRHGESEDFEVCVIGCGAGGGVMAAKLAEAGMRVVVLEAGPFWVPERDWASDEKHQGQLYWSEPRVSGGRDALELGGNNSGRGVGGSTVHFTMVKLRFHGHDLRTRSTEGVGDDWPIGYADLARYYDEVEGDLGVAGPSYFPWGEFQGPYPQRAHPVPQHAVPLFEGCERLGLRAVVTPTATLSSPKDGRPPCTYRGFCVVGCKPGAKSSTLVTYVPRIVAAGGIIKDNSMVTRLRVANGRVISASYVHAGRRHEQRARIFILAGYAIETPRLLLNSATPEQPTGLANSSGLVGKRLMTHMSHRVYAWFEKPVRPYKAPPGIGITQEFYRTPKEGDHVRGYSIETGAALPISFARLVVAGTGEHGWALRKRMLEYNHYSGIAMNGECLPYEENEVRLASETDAYGAPVAHLRFAYGENERRMIDHAYARMEEILRAAGGSRIFRASDTAHLMGTCRMGDDPQTSVVDPWCRTWDVPNLFLCDGSVFVTAAGVNPSLTIEAIAARAADRLAKERA